MANPNTTPNPKTKLSQSPTLPFLASLFGTICIGFGINAILYPLSALSFFEMLDLAATADQKLIHGLMIVYGARDIFMGGAIYATAYFGGRKALGWVLVMVSLVAGVDGWVCAHFVGKGEWGHWGYAPMLTVLGSLLLGVADGI